MRNLDRRAFPVRIGVAAVAALLLLGAAAGSRAATDAQCSAAYNDSSASDDCTTVSIAGLSGPDRCKIVARCPSSSGHQQQDTIYAPLSLTDDLQNCNGSLSYSC